MPMRSVMMMISVLLLCGSLLNCVADDAITTTIEGVPHDVVTQGNVTLTVCYSVPEQMGQVQLNVELKNPENIVLSGQRVQVAGEGEQQFTFQAPPVDAERAITFAVWYGTNWQQALAPIIHTERIVIISREDAGKMQARQEAAAKWLQDNADELADGPVAAVLSANLPGHDQTFAASVADELSRNGVKALAIGVDEVLNSYLLQTDTFHTLVLPHARVYPAEGGLALHRFLAQGGNLIALGTPAFEEAVTMVNGEWLTSEQMRDLLAKQGPDKMIWDMEEGSVDDWGYTSGPDSPASKDYAEGGAADTARALHCDVPNYTSWNTLIAPKVEQPFAEGQSLTCFWARGGPDTSQLSLEWVEQDGSRWIAVVPLEEEWRYYAVSPYEFRYWQDSSSEGRGGSSDHFRPENAARFTVGIAMTHTRMKGGHHEFWIDQIGTATNPLGIIKPAERPDIDAIEMINPSYKFHEVTTAQQLVVSPMQSLVASTDLPVFDGLMSAHPRPQGTGYNKERKWRFIPLLETIDDKGEVCGTPACIIINRTGRFANSITASFALPEEALKHPAILSMVGKIARRIQDGFFLFEGGAEYYAYFQGESVTLGARTISTAGDDAPQCAARFFVTSEVGTEFEQTVPVVDGQAECRWTPGQFARNTYEVHCTLLGSGGEVLDKLTHPVVVWEPPTNPEYMQVKDGDFYLRGKKWYAHGINYMPSSEIGIEDGPYFEFWMDKQPYDPVVTERDLRRIKAMGMNMVSIFCYHRSLDSRNLLDILERCRRHGLMVNLSLRPGTGLDFYWDQMRELIEAYRLKEHDIIFAYDLAWEPNFGGAGSRAVHDEQWASWIFERYGSLENAEADWGMPVPRRDDDTITCPSADQLRFEGDHRVMVCAYRRFLDDLLAKAYGKANRLVKSVDPHHFTSFRMSMAGDPTVGGDWVGYDFRALARSVDIMEPEGYGRIGDWDRVKPGRFTADYSRCMAPGRPVMWAEFGSTSWDKPRMQRNLEQEEWIGGFYRDYYRMADEGYANGTICWYYPGGYRVGENSDFGIINPDGSWRPTSQAIFDNAERMTTPRDPAPVDEWISIDRDATAKGLPGVYDMVKDRYWGLIEEGKNPGLRTDGYGLTSATAPRVAVGNVPYRPGQNPHKYLNAEFDRVEVKNADGEWQAVQNGSAVKIKLHDPVLVRATVGNIGEAKWLSAEGWNRQVVLTAGEAFIPIPCDVPFMGTVFIDGFQVCELQEDMDVTLEMSVWPDIMFGEKIDVRFEVQ